MLSKIPVSLFREWIAYYQIEPFGANKEDYRMASLSATIANVHRSKGKRAYSPKDFMPKQKRQSWKTIKSNLLGAFGYNNGDINSSSKER